jgi:hypothetical protein
MDLQDVAGHGDNSGAPERVHGGPHLIGRREMLASHQDLGAELIVPLRRDVHQRSGHLR